MPRPLLTEHIRQQILLFRGHRVLLDSDLTQLYGVAIKRLNEQVRRNKTRFPADFMFRLTPWEAESLRSQFATLETGRGKHRKYLPYVFTEQGVAMLSSVLNSERAIQVNIAIMRAFVKLRGMLATHRALARKLTQLEQKTGKHDQHIHAIFEAIRHLMALPAAPRRRIGFHPGS